MAQKSDRTRIEAVVCIPTFRRPDWLKRTLASVAQQVTEFGFAVVVVDNDAANPVGADIAREFLQEKDLPHAVFVEENQGNVFAINRAFGEAMTSFPDAEFFLMIDDDEMALPGWLARIVDLARRERADIVGGPVLRQFEGEASEGIRQHPLFFSIDGPSRQLDQIHGSGNCLMRRHVFETLGTPFFDPRFNFLGGGDMDFFTRCRKAGFSTWWCADAVVHEFVPAARISPGFLMTRSIRTGSINYVIDRTRGMPAAKAVLKNVVSFALSFIRAAVLLAKTRRMLPASHPILVSIGRTYAALGFLPEPYKASNNT